MRELSWLWDAVVVPDDRMLDGMRSHRLAISMRLLAQDFPFAKTTFETLRARTEARLAKDPSWDELDGWIALNLEVLDDGEGRVLAWVDRNKGDEDGRRTLRRYQGQVEQLLIEHRRWRDVGTLMHRPIAKVRQQDGVMRIGQSIISDPELTINDEVINIEVDSVARSIYVQEVTQIIFALLAAERVDEAIEAAEVGHELRPDWDMAPAMSELFDGHKTLRKQALNLLAQRDDVPEWLREALD